MNRRGFFGWIGAAIATAMVPIDATRRELRRRRRYRADQILACNLSRGPKQPGQPVHDIDGRLLGVAAETIPAGRWGWVRVYGSVNLPADVDLPGRLWASPHPRPGTGKSFKKGERVW